MVKSSGDARKQAQEIVNSRKRSEKRKKNLIVTAVFSIVIVIIAIVGFLIVKDAENSSNEAESTRGEQITPTTADANGAFYVPANAGDKASETSDATRVDVFFDPQCPGCGVVDRGIGDRLAELVESEEIDLYLTPVSFLDRATTDKYSSRAASAVVTIAEKSPEHALDFVHAIYDENFQPSEGGGSSNVSDEKLAEAAKSVGVPAEIADTIKDQSYVDWVLSHTETTKTRPDLFSAGFSTPSVFLNIEYVDGNATSFTKVQFQDEDVLTTFNDTFSSLTKGN